MSRFTAAPLSSPFPQEDAIATSPPTPDCTDRCRSTRHGDVITAAITRRSVSDSDLCAYLAYACNACSTVRDTAGRTALHVAAACGRPELVRWLVKCRRADLNARDEESGFTALHRSVFYGKINCAVELIRLGANTAILDSDSLTMLEHALKDGFFPNSPSGGGELYVWGSNTNNSLGPQQSRAVPEAMDIFHKKYPGEVVTKVCLGKFHQVIVTLSGNVYACGHGQGGRLGLGTQHTVVIPEPVKFPQMVVQQEEEQWMDAAVARDHSVFLCSDGGVYTCGLNSHRVLGLGPTSNPPAQVLVPTLVKRYADDRIRGVRAGQFHSVIWGPNVLYTCGLNAGQLGHKLRTDGKYILYPKAVRLLDVSQTRILAVDSSDGAISVYTEKGDIFVLHEYQCRKIASRQLNVIQVSIFGGKLDPALSPDIKSDDSHNKELKVAALTNTGNILLWRESDAQLCRCIYNLNRAIVVTQLTLNLNGILFVTKEGEAFEGLIKIRKKKVSSPNNNNNNNYCYYGGDARKSAFHQFLEREDCVTLKLTKFPKIYRAVHIQSDNKGRDFCVIQDFPYKRFDPPKVQQDPQQMTKTLAELLNNCQENHDVVFQVCGRFFPAHRYVVALKSPYLKKLMMDSNEVVHIRGCDLDPLIFEQFLQYCYTNTCDLMQLGECPDKLKHLCQGNNNNNNPSTLNKANSNFERRNSSNSTNENINKTNKNDNNNEDNNSSIEADLAAYGLCTSFSSSKNGRNRNANSNQVATLSQNPVRMLHEMAKKFGCKELYVLLSNYDMHKYVIQNKSGSKRASHKPATFSHSDLPELADVTIKCSDGHEIKAHKCILATQTDYFGSLFSMRWRGAETSEITLPCPKAIVETLLEYIYTDNLRVLNTKEQDQLLKMLVLADQLFINRLKEHCEVLLYYSLTLKNAVQFLCFSHAYNALKLKHCCLKFIASNMAPLLEMQSFNDMDEKLLREVSEFYFEDKPKIWCRVITPYSTAPPEEVILSISSAYPISLDEEKENKVPQRNAQKSRRSRGGHKISSSNDATADRFNQEKNSTSETDKEPREGGIRNSLINFNTATPEIPDYSELSVTHRLKSIKLAQEKLAFEKLQADYVKLTPNSDNNNARTQRDKHNDSSRMSFVEFPVLNSPPKNSNLFPGHSKMAAMAMASSPPSVSYSNSVFSSKSETATVRHKIAKISQKQRKRLNSSESSQQQQQQEVVATTTTPVSSETSKNPWKVLNSAEPPGSSSTSSCSVQNIISYEKKQKENLVKITSKSLVHTQMEDKAIEELRKFYNVDNVMEEIITVERIDMGAVAAPVWVQHSAKKLD